MMSASSYPLNWSSWTLDMHTSSSRTLSPNSKNFLGSDLCILRREISPWEHYFPCLLNLDGYTLNLLSTDPSNIVGMGYQIPISSHTHPHQYAVDMAKIWLLYCLGIPINKNLSGYDRYLLQLFFEKLGQGVCGSDCGF